VDHHGDLPGREAEARRPCGIEDAIHHLHLEEVIPGAQGAHLGAATLEGAVGEGSRIGVVDGAAVLAAGEVEVGAVAAGDGVDRAAEQDGPQVRGRGVPDPAGAGAPRHQPGEGGHDRGQVRPEVGLAERRREQADAAGDVEADAARRDHPAGRRIGGRDAPDGEAVTPVDVRHGERGGHDARQGGDVRDLAEGVIAVDGGQQAAGGEHHAGDAHGPGLIDAPAVVRLLRETQGRPGGFGCRRAGDARAAPARRATHRGRSDRDPAMDSIVGSRAGASSGLGAVSDDGSRARPSRRRWTTTPTPPARAGRRAG